MNSMQQLETQGCLFDAAGLGLQCAHKEFPIGLVSLFGQYEENLPKCNPESQKLSNGAVIFLFGYNLTLDNNGYTSELGVVLLLNASRLECAPS